MKTPSTHSGERPTDKASDTVTIYSIAWLSGITPSIWRIDFSTISELGHHYHGEVLFIKSNRIPKQGMLLTNALLPLQ